MQLPQTPISRLVDPLLIGIGNAVSWIWPLLIAVIVCNVLLRYAFGEGRIEFEEIQWHLYSIGFTLGLGYGLQMDAHVRVDVLYEKWSARARAWVDLYGLVLFVLPFVALFLIYGVPFVIDSYVTSEVSSAPGGLPMRWVIKSFMVTGFVLLGLAAVSRLSRLWSFLFFDRSDDGERDIRERAPGR